MGMMLKAGVLWAVGAAMAHAAELPRPALLVLDKSRAEMMVVDPATLKVVGRAPTGEGPHEVVVTADGKSAVVANYGAQTAGSSLSVIELSTLKEERIDLGALRRPHGIQEGGGKIWFTVEGNKAVGHFDPASGAVDGLIGTGQDATHMLVVNADQSKVYTANIASHTVTVIERAQGPGLGGWRVTQIAVGRGPEGIDLSPDGRELWTAHSQDGGVSIIDTATTKVKETLPAMTKRSNRLKFTPDGKRVLISDLESGDLLVLDAAGRRLEQRLALGGMPVGILVAPDGRLAFIACQRAGEVVVLDLKTLRITSRIKTGGAPDGMAWRR